MRVRSFSEHRPPQPGPGGRNRRQGLFAALIALLVLAGGLTACGGSSGPKTASDWLPSLDSLGFQGQPQTQALINGDHGSAVELYQRASPAAQARVDVALFGAESDAQQAYMTTAQAMSALPPNLFGANATQEKTQALSKGDAATAYETKEPDPQGNHVWTDVYRFGNTVAVTFVIDNDSADAARVRTKLADELASNK